MTIPTVSNFPKSVDTDVNLYVAHDGLRLVLAEDYTPGDASITIYVDEDQNVMDKFPDSGIITLTEQLSDIDERAITFHYTFRTSTTFNELTIFPNFTDVVKPKDYTHVTLNVVADHHNNLKDAMIAVETFLGVKGTTDLKAFGDALTGRINFLSKLILTPRAWFTADKTIGLVPLEVVFSDQSFRLGENCADIVGVDGTVTYLWDFGDQTSSVISVISVFSAVPPGQTEVVVQDMDGGKITKIYSSPGKYDVKLTVRNHYGEDTVIFEDMINARIEAPFEADIDVIIGGGQTMLSNGSLRTGTGLPVNIEVLEGPIPDALLSPVRSHAGEPLTDVMYDGGIPTSGTAIDPIANFTWNLSDDLTHANTQVTKALYSVGGLYDIILRTDTTLDAYRITTQEKAIDVIEEQNLWLWNFPAPVTQATNDLDRLGVSGTITAHEYGLLSETFKVASTGYSVIRDETFLDNTNNETQARKEFRRNTGFTRRSSTSSGRQGTSVMFWSQENEVIMTEYSGFFNIYTTPFAPSPSPPATPLTITRPWNWLNLNSEQRSYFLFGTSTTALPNENKSNQVKDVYNLFDSTNPLDSTTLTLSNYIGGAEELINHPTNIYDGGGEPDNGRFAVYRTCWKDNAGYITRNIAPGSSDSAKSYFRIEDFYKTEGIAGEEVTNFVKLTNMAGPVKMEGQLVALTTGVFFFDNTGYISAYNTNTESWETGGPSSSSIAFRSLQDTSVNGFDDRSRTLLAASDNNYTAYLSYDYSPNAFVKFNAQDLTYTFPGARPEGRQFVLSVY